MHAAISMHARAPAEAAHTNRHPPPAPSRQVYKSPALLQELTRPGLDDAPGAGSKRKAA